MPILKPPLSVYSLSSGDQTVGWLFCPNEAQHDRWEAKWLGPTDVQYIELMTCSGLNALIHTMCGHGIVRDTVVM